jgi:hypothetical protein
MIILILQNRHAECTESTPYQCKLCYSYYACVHYGLFLWHVINLLLQYMHVCVMYCACGSCLLMQTLKDHLPGLQSLKNLMGDISAITTTIQY